MGRAQGAERATLGVGSFDAVLGGRRGTQSAVEHVLSFTFAKALDERQRAKVEEYLRTRLDGDRPRVNWPSECRVRVACMREPMFGPLCEGDVPWARAGVIRLHLQRLTNVSISFSEAQDADTGAEQPPAPAHPKGLSTRQLEAFFWLQSVGKASAVTLKRHGFQDRTLRKLVELGHARVEYRSAVNAPYPMYYPLDEPKDSQS